MVYNLCSELELGKLLFQLLVYGLDLFQISPLTGTRQLVEGPMLEITACHMWSEVHCQNAPQIEGG